jgi:cytochrome c556
MRTILAVLFGVILLSTDFALAQVPKKDEHKITLRAIMQELQAEALRLINALLIEDLGTLQASAKAIQGHPMPPEIVAAIKNKLGGKFHGFEVIDEQSHKAAGDLSKQAAAKNVMEAAKAYGRLTEACVNCHKQYRVTLRPLSD